VCKGGPYAVGGAGQVNHYHLSTESTLPPLQVSVKTFSKFFVLDDFTFSQSDYKI
jgi:hypothetical protein